MEWLQNNALDLAQSAATVALAIAAWIGLRPMPKRLKELLDTVEDLKVPSTEIPRGHRPHVVYDESGPGQWIASKSPDGTIHRHRYFPRGIPEGHLSYTTEDE